MVRLPVRYCYDLAARSQGREVAARYMARLFAERLREGIAPEDAEELASILERLAEGVAPSIALGFVKDGRPNNFDRDLAIYERVEDLFRQRLPLKDCYKRVATAHQLSEAAIKKIHLDMRKAHFEARAPGED